VPAFRYQFALSEGLVGGNRAAIDFQSAPGHQRGPTFPTGIASCTAPATAAAPGPPFRSTRYEADCSAAQQRAIAFAFAPKAL